MSASNDDDGELVQFGHRISKRTRNRFKALAKTRGVGDANLLEDLLAAFTDNPAILDHDDLLALAIDRRDMAAAEADELRAHLSKTEHEPTTVMARSLASWGLTDFIRFYKKIDYSERILSAEHLAIYCNDYRWFLENPAHEAAILDRLQKKGASTCLAFPSDFDPSASDAGPAHHFFHNLSAERQTLAEVSRNAPDNPTIRCVRKHPDAHMPEFIIISDDYADATPYVASSLGRSWLDEFIFQWRTLPGRPATGPHRLFDEHFHLSILIKHGVDDTTLLHRHLISDT